jgi:hypothetical protein
MAALHFSPFSRRRFSAAASAHALHQDFRPSLAWLARWYSVSRFTSPHRVHAFVASLTTPNPSVNRTLAGGASVVIVAFVAAKAGYLKR